MLLARSRNRSTIPLVADIHFDYRLAIAAMEAGADKIRINPGNIGSKERVRAVVEVAKERNIPIRVGVNSGSLEKEIRSKGSWRDSRGYRRECIASSVRSLRIWAMTIWLSASSPQMF